jgi:hypothetical protein
MYVETILDIFGNADSDRGDLCCKTVPRSESCELL